jgi:hypothetical protein
MMSERYVAKVVKVIDQYSVVINIGTANGVNEGDKFMIIKLGEVIIDPDTNEELERLELIVGKCNAVHVQERISTIKSIITNRHPDKREVQKVTSKGGLAALAALHGETKTTETITPGSEYVRSLDDPEVGDVVVRI